MISLTIDGQPVTVPDGNTILDAARQLGVNIPTLYFLAGVKEGWPSCLACVVKVGNDSRLVPSCTTKAQDGMVVGSGTPEVKAVRKAALGGHRPGAFAGGGVGGTTPRVARFVLVAGIPDRGPRRVRRGRSRGG
jgi:ferredoxin